MQLQCHSFKVVLCTVFVAKVWFNCYLFRNFAIYYRDEKQKKTSDAATKDQQMSKLPHSCCHFHTTDLVKQLNETENTCYKLYTDILIFNLKLNYCILVCQIVLTVLLQGNGYTLENVLQIRVKFDFPFDM